jgi:hypothetical protein
MKVSKNESGAIGLIAVALVVGLVVGFAVTRVVDNHNNKKTTTTASVAPTSATAAADLRANLVTLGLQHMTLTDQAIDAALDGDKDASAVGAALYTNGTDLGATVGSVYGASAQTTFNTVWKLHLDQFVDYAVADAQGNAAAKTAALNTINTQYTVPLAQYLAKANPYLPEATLQSALSDHVAMTAVMIDDHVQGKYTDEQAELKMADTHMEGLFSTLAEGIIKQYPSKFSN